MASTYEPIATTTLGSAVSSSTFSSIPSTYTDLILVLNLGNSTNVGLWVNLNSDTGNNYSGTRLWGDGSAVGTDRQSNYGSFIIDVSDGKTTLVHFQNYSKTTTYKTMLSRFSSTTGAPGANVGLWRNTAAINSITVNSSPAMAIGTTLTLYGIKAA